MFQLFVFYCMLPFGIQINDLQFKKTIVNAARTQLRSPLTMIRTESSFSEL